MKTLIAHTIRGRTCDYRAQSPENRQARRWYAVIERGCSVPTPEHLDNPKREQADKKRRGLWFASRDQRPSVTDDGNPNRPGSRRPEVHISTYENVDTLDTLDRAAG